MSNNVLSVVSLAKQFKKKFAVKDVSFKMEAGEIVGLLGPNGAGKTTIFYMIVGFIKVTGGQIFLNNLEITHQPMYIRAKEGISYLPQEASIFKKLTVEDAVIGQWSQFFPEQSVRLLISPFRLWLLGCLGFGNR